MLYGFLFRRVIVYTLCFVCLFVCKQFKVKYPRHEMESNIEWFSHQFNYVLHFPDNLIWFHNFEWKMQAWWNQQLRRVDFHVRVCINSDNLNFINRMYCVWRRTFHTGMCVYIFAHSNCIDYLFAHTMVVPLPQPLLSINMLAPSTSPSFISFIIRSLIHSFIHTLNTVRWWHRCIRNLCSFELQNHNELEIHTTAPRSYIFLAHW